MKKLLKLVLCFVVLFLIVGCKDNKQENVEETKKITVVIVGEKNQELFNKQIETSRDKLVDVLNDEKVSLVIEDGPYGAYITSLMELKEKSTKKGMYYWAYYINDEYADTGISNCVIKDGKTYKFVYEYYEN